MDVAAGIKASGDMVQLTRTDPRHMAGIGGGASALRAAPDGGGPERDFGNMLFRALSGVNDMQKQATELTNRMITSPDSVNVQDVMIASAEANLAISMTKAIVDRALTAYREIINVR